MGFPLYMPTLFIILYVVSSGVILLRLLFKGHKKFQSTDEANVAMVLQER